MNSAFDANPVVITPVCLGRQPIFDRRLNVVAYELLYRDSQNNQAVFAQDDDATGQVLWNTLVEIGLDRVVGSQQAYINFSPSFILNGHCAALPAERVVLELLEGADPNDSLVTALEDLVRSGFRLALDDFVFQPGYERLLRLASIVKLDLRAGQNDLAEQVSRIEGFGVTILAEKVETPDEYDRCLDLGFELFQGYFFARPRIVGGRRTPSDRLSTLRLVAALNAPEISLGQIESLVVREPTLVQKLLKFINSTHCGLRVPVESIRTAIALVGLRKLRTWATLLTLGGMKHFPPELMVLANVRARMCETISDIHGSSEGGTYFTVGLLSVLDVLAGRPMEEILDELPLSAPVKAALLHREGKIGATLQAVLDYEAGLRVPHADADLQIDASQLAQAYLDAVVWTDAQFNALAHCGG
jgi:c-di-GMP phosphodiesterase